MNFYFMEMWGIWKKIKRGFSKAKSWLSNALSKAKPTLQKGVEFLQKSKPVIQKIDFGNVGWGIMNEVKTKIDKVSDDIINLNDKIQQGDYAGAINYAGRQFIPKFKN